ncbi:DUF2808 domain-containing protein [Mastigocladopsis repens]|uniref:DUF2808 domain-containing protein n=1 Tax=Mastigocladopsis repens TaxID=221287 RepID=UPI000474DDAA|nr:DUF2808 domain-containing protein [Mastigocladopsis repens]
MKKLLMYTAVLALATALSIPATHVSARNDDSNVTHIDGNEQFAPTRRGLARHTFRVHIPKNSKGVSQLSIEVPTTVTLTNDIDDIDVVDENGQKINTNVSVNGKTILLSFTEPVAPNTDLEIDLNDVKRRHLGNSYVYRFRAKFAGSDAEIPIGVASFRMHH